MIPTPTSAIARPGARSAPLLLVEMVRELTETDLVTLAAPQPAAERQTVAKLSHRHHALAQALARGEPPTKAGLAAGYTAATVYSLQKDPAFCELLEYYAAQRELVHLDLLEKMKVLGLDTLEELQARLEADPTVFSHRELMELFKLMAIEGRAGPGSRQGVERTAGGAGAAPVNVNVQFVTASAKETVVVEATAE